MACLNKRQAYKFLQTESPPTARRLLVWAWVVISAKADWQSGRYNEAFLWRHIHGDFFGSANFDDKKRAVNGTYYSGMISFVGNLC